MKKRLLALVLVAVLLVGLFAGCSKSQDPSDPGQPSETNKSSKKEEETVSAMGKYAFKPRWIPLEVEGEHQPEYVGNYVISGDYMYFYAECMDKEEPMIDVITGEPVIDETTGEPYMQSFYRSFVFRMDMDTGVVTELSAFVPFKAPEGHEGSAYITDVGRTGAVNSVLGLDKDASIARFILPPDIKKPPFKVAEGKGQLCGVVIKLDEKTGKAEEIIRICKSGR